MLDLSDEAFAARFRHYVERIGDVLGHADRVKPMTDYCTGLLLPLERKSVEPMAGATAPERASAQHQSMLHFVGQSRWSDEAVMDCAYRMVTPSIERSGRFEALVVDDTSFPKKGTHSVGVKRQYCGQLGKTENCQQVVTVSVASEAASLPVAARLFLPELWANDPVLRQKAKVPEHVSHQSKPDIALDLIRDAIERGVAKGVVLADAGFGGGASFRIGVSALGLPYAVAIRPITNVWRQGEAPVPTLRRSKRGPWPKGQKPAPHRHVPARPPILAPNPRQSVAAERLANHQLA